MDLRFSSIETQVVTCDLDEVFDITEQLFSNVIYYNKFTSHNGHDIVVVMGVNRNEEVLRMIFTPPDICI